MPSELGLGCTREEGEYALSRGVQVQGRGWSVISAARFIRLTHRTPHVAHVRWVTSMPVIAPGNMWTMVQGKDKETAGCDGCVSGR